MPRGDGTGPNSMGPMTGGGFGYCNNNDNQTQYGNRLGCGRGFFRGRKSGRGTKFGNRFFNNSFSNEKVDLERKKEYFQSKLDLVKKQLENLD